MKSKTLKNLHKNQAGSSIVESLIAIILMCVICFGVMQIYHYAMTKMVASYAAFNGAKALRLGYTTRIAERTVHLSSLGISGKDNSSPKINTLTKNQLRDKMQLYLMTGNANLDFEYWDPIRRNDPELVYDYDQEGYQENMYTIRVVVQDVPMLDGVIANLLQLGMDSASPSGEVTFYNDSEKYLE